MILYQRDFSGNVTDDSPVTLSGDRQQLFAALEISEAREFLLTTGAQVSAQGTGANPGHSAG